MLGIFSSMYHAVFGTDPTVELRRAGLLSGEMRHLNRLLLNSHHDKYDLACALRTLNDAGLLSQANAQFNYTSLIKHRHLPWVNQSFKNLLTIAPTAEHLVLLRRHANLADLSLNLSVAYDLGLLSNPDNFYAIYDHENPSDLFFILGKVFRMHMRAPEAQLLTDDNVQDKFNDIVSIISSPSVVSALQRIPDQMLDLGLFQQIIEIAETERANPALARERMIAVLERVQRDQAAPIQQSAQAQNPRPWLLRQAPQEGQHLRFYPYTHTKTVESSAAESAINLTKRYGEYLNVADELREIRLWLNNIPINEDVTDLKIRYVKESFTRITSFILSEYTEKESGVNIKVLLALIWRAFKDQKLMTASLADAQKQLFEALYVSQYGDSQFPICAHGTFNKLIEAGWGLHADMTIIFIDKTMVHWKLIAIVRDEAIHYLNGLNSPEQCLAHLQAIRERSNDHSVEPIWEHIESKVSIALLQEFSTFFKTGLSSAQFKQDYIEPGKDVALSEQSLNNVESRLNLSPSNKQRLIG